MAKSVFMEKNAKNERNERYRDFLIGKRFPFRDEEYVISRVRMVAKIDTDAAPKKGKIMKLQRKEASPIVENKSIYLCMASRNGCGSHCIIVKDNKGAKIVYAGNASDVGAEFSRLYKEFSTDTKDGTARR
jgi:hypothetical protein